MPDRVVRNIVIVDSDKEFYSKLSVKFFKELNIQPLEFSDVKRFLDYRKKLNYIDILMISEDYITSIESPDIASYVFVFTKTEEDLKRSDGFYNLFRYRNPVEIFNDVLRVCGVTQGAAFGSKVITFYSPLGNCGKTILSLSAGWIMASQYSKVLYVNMESLCSMAAFLPNVQLSGDNLDTAIRSHSERAWSVIHANIQTSDNFSYLKPFNEIGALLDLSYQDYAFLIQLIKKQNIYQRIIIDMPSDFNYKLTSVLQQSDKVVIVCRQDDYSTLRLSHFLSVNRPNDKDKYIFVCNKKDKSKPDYLKASSILSGQNVLEEMPLLDIKRSQDALSALTANKAVKLLANTLM